MRGVPGQLLEEPFRDFEYNRNHVLQSHGNRTLCVSLTHGRAPFALRRDRSGFCLRIRPDGHLPPLRSADASALASHRHSASSCMLTYFCLRCLAGMQ